MILLLVSYDLNRPVQNYAGLDSGLYAMGGKRALETVWFVPASARLQVEGLMRRLLDANDMYVVVPFDSATATGRVSSEAANLAGAA